MGGDAQNVWGTYGVQIWGQRQWGGGEGGRVSGWRDEGGRTKEGHLLDFPFLFLGGTSFLVRGAGVQYNRLYTLGTKLKGRYIGIRMYTRAACRVL